MSSSTEYQADQAALSTLLARQVASLWPLLDPANMVASLPQLVAAIAALLRQYGAASATVAADYYEAERAAARVRAPFTVVPADVPSLEQVESNVRWATKSLWAPEPDEGPAREMVKGVAQTMMSDTARQTIITNAQRDPKARGWARIPEPTACSFCMMLATRGPVYSQTTVEFRAHEPHLNKTGKLVGGVCECHAGPVFGEWEPSEQIRTAQDLYADVAGSGSAAAVRRAFRRSYEASQKTS